MVLFIGNIGVGEIIVLLLFLILPFGLLLRAIIRYLNRH